MLGQQTPKPISPRYSVRLCSGTTCNVIPTTHLPQIGNPEVLPSSSTLVVYNNNEVKPDGVVKLECRKNGHTLTLEFQVTSGRSFNNKPPLISGTDSELLDIIKISADEIHELSSLSSQDSPFNSAITKKCVLDKYSDVFRGLGCIGD